MPAGTSGSPIICGIDGPNTSASMMPTRLPSRDSAAARLVATVDLPTPPLPAATAMMFLTVFRRSGRGPNLRATSAVNATSTSLTPATDFAAASTAARMASRDGQDGVVSRTVTFALPPSQDTSRNISVDSRSRPSAGSFTCETALRSSSTVDMAIPLSSSSLAAARG